jgi:hypothetical protein
MTRKYYRAKAKKPESPFWVDLLWGLLVIVLVAAAVYFLKVAVDSAN